MANRADNRPWAKLDAMGRDHSPGTRANPQRQGLIAGLLAALSFGLSAPLISVVSGEGSPLMIAALLYAGAALALVLREVFTVGMALASASMLHGVAVLLREDHSHWHRHQALRHAHVSDVHHRHGHDGVSEGSFPS